MKIKQRLFFLFVIVLITWSLFRTSEKPISPPSTISLENEKTLYKEAALPETHALFESMSSNTLDSPESFPTDNPELPMEEDSVSLNEEPIIETYSYKNELGLCQVKKEEDCTVRYSHGEKYKLYQDEINGIVEDNSNSPITCLSKREYCINYFRPYSESDLLHYLQPFEVIAYLIDLEQNDNLQKDHLHNSFNMEYYKIKLENLKNEFQNSFVGEVSLAYEQDMENLPPEPSYSNAITAYKAYLFKQSNQPDPQY